MATVHPLLRVLNHGGSLVARGGGEGVDGLDRVRAGLVDDVHVVLVKQVHLVHDGCRHVRRGDSVTHDGKRISVLDDAAASSIFDELFRDVADVAREPGVVLTHAHGVDELVDRGASHALGVHVPSRHGVVARDAAGLGGLAAECPSVDAQRGHGVAGPLGEARVVVVHDVELPRTAGSGASGSPDVKEHPRVLGAINWECSDSASQVEVVGEDKIDVVDAVVFPVGDAVNGGIRPAAVVRVALHEHPLVGHGTLGGVVGNLEAVEVDARLLPGDVQTRSSRTVADLGGPVHGPIVPFLRVQVARVPSPSLADAVDRGIAR